MARLPKGTKQRSNGTYERRFTFKGKRVSVYGNTLKELDTKEFEKRKELESKGVVSCTKSAHKVRIFTGFLCDFVYNNE